MDRGRTYVQALNCAVLDEVEEKKSQRQGPGPGQVGPSHWIDTPAPAQQVTVPSNVRQAAELVPEMQSKIQDACAGHDPEALAALKNLGFNCQQSDDGSYTLKRTAEPTEADVIANMREAAKTRPDYKVVRQCPAGKPCQTVESATRAPDQAGTTGTDNFVTIDGSLVTTWCYRSNQTGHTSYRVCSASNDPSSTPVIETYFSETRDWRVINTDPASNPFCKPESKYDLDDAYIACIVKQQSPVPPAPATPSAALDAQLANHKAVLNRTPWPKDATPAEKVARFNEKLKAIAIANQQDPSHVFGQATESLNELIEQGYADPATKWASDWVCQQERETPGSYLSACHAAANLSHASEGPVAVQPPVVCAAIRSMVFGTPEEARRAQAACGPDKPHRGRSLVPQNHHGRN
jgi:hypothetical protein